MQKQLANHDLREKRQGFGIVKFPFHMVLSALNAGGIKYPRIMLSQPCSGEVNYIA